MRHVVHPIQYMYKIFPMLHSLILPSAWKWTHTLPPPCGAVQSWDVGKETPHVSVVQAHFSTDIRWLPTGHQRWQGVLLPAFFPTFKMTIAVHKKRPCDGKDDAALLFFHQHLCHLTGDGCIFVKIWMTLKQFNLLKRLHIHCGSKLIYRNLWKLRRTYLSTNYWKIYITSLKKLLSHPHVKFFFIDNYAVFSYKVFSFQ